MDDRLVTSIVGILVVLVHSPIMLLILTSSDLRTKRSNHLLLNLSLGHILTGLSNAIGPWTHLPWGTFSFGGYCYANVCQLMLTIDRLLYIRFPFRYVFISPRLHVSFLLASPVAYISIIVYRLTRKTLVAIEVDRVAMLSFIICVSVFMLLFMIPNTVLFAIVRKQHRAIVVTSTTTFKKSAKSRLHRKEFTAFYICFGCVLTFTCFWLPPLVIKVDEFVRGHTHQRFYFQITIAIANLNPLMDAFILVFFKRDVRKRVKNVAQKSK